MDRFKFVLNRQGVNELLRGEGMAAVVGEYGNRVQQRAGPQYRCEVRPGRSRVSATIRADSPHAYYSNLKHNTLLKALGG